MRLCAHPICQLPVPQAVSQSTRLAHWSTIPGKVPCLLMESGSYSSRRCWGTGSGQDERNKLRESIEAEKSGSTGGAVLVLLG